VVRQLRYSRKNENSLDLVLFSERPAIITAELKTPDGNLWKSRQTYQTDRDRPKPAQIQTLLVHFAGRQRESLQYHALQKANTPFCPLIRYGKPGQPLRTSTAYYGKTCGSRGAQSARPLSVLETEKRNFTRTSKQVVTVSEERLLFPRFQQLDVCARFWHRAREGVGMQNLVQHSAGSGKSNSIAAGAQLAITA
jgi:type I restriction enzyme R subunit